MCYISDMMKQQIQTILEDFDTWPADKQLLAYEVLKWIQGKDYEPLELSPEEEAELDEALAEADREELLSEEEMKAFFDKHRQ